jgi:hypothetical protein
VALKLQLRAGVDERRARRAATVEAALDLALDLRLRATNDGLMAGLATGMIVTNKKPLTLRTQPALGPARTLRSVHCPPRGGPCSSPTPGTWSI